MGTIISRKRKDGTKAFTAQIRIRRDGKIIHNETETFERRQVAVVWIKKRETELAVPGALDRPKDYDSTLKMAIERYIQESERAIGKTKTQVLRTIMNSDLGSKPCSAIKSTDLIEFIHSLTSQPQTRGNYMSHLAAVFAVAKPAWGMALDQEAMRDARAVTKRLGTTGKSRKRDRRPTLAELDLILTYFVDMQKRRPESIPMPTIIVFALFSTRRQEEITRITWADLDIRHSRVMVRDMKNPGQKIGNDVMCDLVPEAIRAINATPQKDDRIYPYNPKSIGTSFTNACAFLAIEDLHFHDLRHEGVSRLFEMGWTIPHVAAVSGHRSWQSLQRYTHVREIGDKFADWKWLNIIDHAHNEA